MSEPMAVVRHGDGCTCTKCVGFASGNQHAVTHGGYSTIAIGARAAELAEEIREVVPVRSPADEPSIRLLGQVLAQVERGIAALERLESETSNPLAPYLVEDADRLGRLRTDVRGWMNTARRLCSDLGLSPTSRARLGLDIASRERALSIVEYYRTREAAGLPAHDDEDDE